MATFYQMLKLRISECVLCIDELALPGLTEVFLLRFSKGKH